MTIQSLRRRLTVDDYHKMIDVGIFQEDDRVELLDGEIYDMSPVDAIHAGQVKWLSQFLIQWAGGRVIVSIQDPIQLDDYSEPQPDLALLRWRDDFYRQHHPTANDILLIIEVANTSASSDRTEKLPRYAAAGIPEVWIVNIKRRVIEQYTQPDGDEYVNRKMVRRGVITSNCVSPGLQLSIDQVFGPEQL